MMGFSNTLHFFQNFKLSVQPDCFTMTFSAASEDLVKDRMDTNCLQIWIFRAPLMPTILGEISTVDKSNYSKGWQIQN